MSVLPDARTARVWLAINVAFPVVICLFAVGVILVVDGQPFGIWVALAAWLVQMTLMAANGWVYVKIKQAQRSSRGRTGGGVGPLRAILPLPRTVASALGATGTAVASWMPVVVSGALLGMPVVAVMMLFLYLEARF